MKKTILRLIAALVLIAAVNAYQTERVAATSCWLADFYCTFGWGEVITTNDAHCNAAFVEEYLHYCYGPWSQQATPYWCDTGVSCLPCPNPSPSGCEA